MKRTITGMALVSALVFTATAWSQESQMDRGKMGMGKMKMGKMEMGKSSQMNACMKMMARTPYMPGGATATTLRNMTLRRPTLR